MAAHVVEARSALAQAAWDFGTAGGKALEQMGFRRLSAMRYRRARGGAIIEASYRTVIPQTRDEERHVVFRFTQVHGPGAGRLKPSPP